MPSFDIVSRANVAEVDNALNGARREIGERYDFKESNSTLVREENTITLATADDYKLKQMHEIMAKYVVRRGIEMAALDFTKAPESASGGTLRQVIAIKQGIPQELGKRIVKALKDSGMKVQASIQGEEVRVSGKKRDDLQSAIALIKQQKVDQPLQFINFRE